MKYTDCTAGPSLPTPGSREPLLSSFGYMLAEANFATKVPILLLL